VVVSETFRDRRENVRVENGNLILEVRKDNAEGQRYTSGSVRTADPNSLTYMDTYGNKKYFKPGRIEARIRIAQGRGLINAFWLISNWITLGSSYDFSINAEIDVLEAVGYDTDEWYGAVTSIGGSISRTVVGIVTRSLSTQASRVWPAIIMFGPRSGTKAPSKSFATKG
jgi:beta-glucanase (GH16 family)